MLRYLEGDGLDPEGEGRKVARSLEGGLGGELECNEGSVGTEPLGAHSSRRGQNGGRQTVISYQSIVYGVIARGVVEGGRIEIFRPYEPSVGTVIKSSVRPEIVKLADIAEVNLVCAIAVDRIPSVIEIIERQADGSPDRYAKNR